MKSIMGEIIYGEFSILDEHVFYINPKSKIGLKRNIMSTFTIRKVSFNNLKGLYLKKSRLSIKLF